jgi:hypothetical protein
MRAITYRRPGDPSVLELVERPTPAYLDFRARLGRD